MVRVEFLDPPAASDRHRNSLDGSNSFNESIKTALRSNSGRQRRLEQPSSESLPEGAEGPRQEDNGANEDQGRRIIVGNAPGVVPTAMASRCGSVTSSSATPSILSLQQYQRQQLQAAAQAAAPQLHRRRLQALLQNPSEQAIQARRAGHVTADHFWKLAAYLSGQQWYAQTRWLEEADIVSLESSTLPATSSWLDQQQQQAQQDEDNGLTGYYRHRQRMREELAVAESSSPRSALSPSVGGSSSSSRRRGRSWFGRMFNGDSVADGGEITGASRDGASSYGENYSVASSERAMKRGIRRGQRAGNETQKSHSRRALDSHSVDLQTLAETASLFPHSVHSSPPALQQQNDYESNNRRHGRRSNSRSRPRHATANTATTSSSTVLTKSMWKDWTLVRGHYSSPARRITASSSSSVASSHRSVHNDPSVDAWMCGVCSKAFSTLEAAEKHEDAHIQQVLQTLPWYSHQQSLADASFCNSSTGTTTTTTGGLSMPRAQSLHRGALPMPRSTDTLEEEKVPEGENPWDVPPDVPVSPFARLKQQQQQQQLTEWTTTNNASKPSEQPLVPRLRSDMRVARGISFDDGDDPPAPAPQLLLDDTRHSDSSALRDVPSNIVQRSYQKQKQQQNLHTSEGLSRLRGPLLEEYNEEEEDDHNEALLISSTMREYVILVDEALEQVCRKAERFLLSDEESRAERELAYLARDKFYYDDLVHRSLDRQVNPTSHTNESHSFLGKVSDKFTNAYTLMKEGAAKKSGVIDEYKQKQLTGTDGQRFIGHTQNTLYLNVMVKNGIQVVKNELVRLARERWEAEEEIDTKTVTRFERFRLLAHVNMVRLARLALASDFTPRRIAVQLSNDLYRLLTPRLKRRGVTIESEIEYRVGPYFVLAVNIRTIDWRRLIKATHRDVVHRRAKWKADQQLHLQNMTPEEEAAAKTWMNQIKAYGTRTLNLRMIDIVAIILSSFNGVHWIVYQPICVICYYTFFGHVIRNFIISSAADEVFYYVEERGMEMEIQIKHAASQAAFMLSALREIRADGKELKKQRKQTESQQKGNLLGPLLGPAIKADKKPAEKPADFEFPEHLEYLGLELDLAVGFRRLRWAFLSSKSTFITEALYRVEAKYDIITMGDWDNFDDHIGEANVPDSVNESDFVGATKEASYLMPRSAFVKANMCTETHYIMIYNDYCFCLKKKALTPEVPYGSTFVAWTQFTVINTGEETCKLYCSVEPEFPNGPPLVSRQIKSGMRAGVSELFVLIGETITKYADEFPE